MRWTMGRAARLWACAMAAVWGGHPEHGRADEAPATAADIPVAAFSQMPRFRGIELSPDGTHIAYRMPIDGLECVIVHPVGDASKPVVIPPFKDTFIRWFRWGNDERLVVSFDYATDRFWVNGYRLLGGRNAEETRLFSFARDGSDLDKPASLARPEKRARTGKRTQQYGSVPMDQDTVIDWLPDDPDHFLLAVDGDFDGDAEVRRVKVKNGRFRTVFDDVRDIDWWVTDQNHQVRFGAGGSAGNTRGLYRPPGGGAVDVSDSQWFKDDFRPVAFEADPRYAVAVGPVDGNTQGVVRLDMVTGEILETLYHRPEHDVLPLFEGNTDTLIGFTGIGFKAGRRYTDPEWAKLRRSVDHVFKDRNNYFATATPDRTVLIVHSTSDVDAGMLYVWDRNSQQVFPLAQTYPGLPPDLMSEMKPVTYAARDGLEISGFLTTPRGAAADKLPLVVMPHGGPWSRDGWGFDFLVQLMASRGYAVLQPNFRGSVAQGQAFEEAGQKQWGGKMQDDVTDSVRWLIDQGVADPDRVCIVGWSYGGYAALMGAVKTPDLYRCAVSINGVANLPKLAARYRFSASWRRYVDENIGLEGESMKTVSPHHQADRITVPILIVHAKDDHRVPFEHGRDMAGRLADAGKPHRFVAIEQGGHSLVDGTGRLAMAEALTAFLEQAFGPDTTQSASTN